MTLFSFLFLFLFLSFSLSLFLSFSLSLFLSFSLEHPRLDDHVASPRLMPAELTRAMQVAPIAGPGYFPLPSSLLPFTFPSLFFFLTYFLSFFLMNNHRSTRKNKFSKSNYSKKAENWFKNCFNGEKGRMKRRKRERECVFVKREREKQGNTHSPTI